jgi:hypothetical protein
VEAAWQSKVS